AASDGSDLSGKGLAERKKDVPVIVRVLENRVPAIRIQPPAGGLDDFVVTVQGGRARDEVQSRGGPRRLALALARRRRSGLADLDLQQAAEAGAVVVQRNQIGDRVHR